MKAISAMTLPLARPQPRGEIIAIASGKGGVGKTWFAITLAHALAQSGGRTLLFDADLGLANVDIQLGLMPEHDLAGVLSGHVAVGSACMRHPGGFDILAGRSGSGDLAALDTTALERIRHLLHQATQRYQYVVVDLGAGLDAFVRQMTSLADIVLVVVTDEPTSLTDAYAVLKLHQGDVAPRAPVARVIINQAANRNAGERTYATLARACQSFLGHTPRLGGIIRRDDKVRDAIRRQTLLLTRHPSADAALDVTNFAHALRHEAIQLP